MGTAIEHPVPDRVKPSLFVIFDIRALWHSRLSVRVPGRQKLQINPVWHSTLYSGTHITTVGVKGLTSWPSTDKSRWIRNNIQDIVGCYLRHLIIPDEKNMLLGFTVLVIILMHMQISTHRAKSHQNYQCSLPM